MQNQTPLPARQVPKNWQKVKLGEIANINTNSIDNNYQYSEIEYIDISSVGIGELLQATKYKLSEAPGRARRLIRDGDTILSTVRPNRRSFYFIKNLSPNTVVSTGFAVLNPKDIIDSRFLYYLVTQQSFTNYLVSNVKGSAYPAITSDVIENAEVMVPHLNEQKKIASVLSAFDDKIEVNNKIAKNLEEMAQAIYKEWFVYFKFPGYQKSEFVDTKLGKIPEGWEVKFPDIAYFQEGPGIRNWQYREIGIPFINIRCFRSGEIDLSDANCLDPEEVEKTYSHFLLNEGDFIVSSSGTLGRIAKVRKYHLPLMLNTSVIRITPKEGFKGYCFIKYFLRSSYYQNQINAFATGSAQPNYGPSHLKEFSAIRPSEEITELFESIVFPMEKVIDKCVGENQKLAVLRDLLLPKLMRGEINV